MLITKTITRRDRSGHPPLSETEPTIARTILITRSQWGCLPEPRAATVRRLIDEFRAAGKGNRYEKKI